MDINNKLPGFKSFLKASIDQSAVAPSEQNNIGFNLKQKNGNNEEKSKKKHQKDLEQNKEPETVKKPTEAEVKVTNIKLLNLL